MPRNRSECDTRKLIEAYESGKKIEELVKIFGLSQTSIYNRLNEAGCLLRNVKLSDGVGCPFLCASNFSTIRCESGGDWDFLQLKFRNTDESKSFRRRFCLKDYISCPIYKLNKENYED